MEANKEYLEITAAKDAGGKHRVAGLAYSGGKMRLFGWARPVVVDLSGMTVPESVPLLANHENHTLGRVGVVTAKADGGRLAIEGDIVAGGELAEAIVAQGKAGADWQLSIGAEVEAAELVQEGRRKVNGVEHDAPFYHVNQMLRMVHWLGTDIGIERFLHLYQHFLRFFWIDCHPNDIAEIFFKVVFLIGDKLHSSLLYGHNTV